MAEYAVMPIADYQDACDAVRERTGGTEDIKSGDMGAHIRAITGGENLDEELKQQERSLDSQVALIAELQVALAGKKAGSGAADLPTGYCHAGYIQFNGAQIVDTGIICNQDTKIRVVFTRESSDSMSMYGVASSGNTASVTAYLSSNGNWRFGNQTIALTIGANNDVVHTAIQSKSGIKISNKTATYSTVSNFEAIGSMLIGTSRNASGSVGSAQFVGKILVWEMYGGDELVQKLIPVVSSDGVYRFYDTVSQTFFDSITDTPLEGGNL